MNEKSADIKKQPKSKWDEIQKRLLYIKCLKIKGYKEKVIAEKLGICPATLKRYKKLYPEMEDALSFDKYMADAMVEAALLKLATGYVVKVNKSIKLKDSHYDENGKKVEKEKLESYVDEVHIAPNLSAQTFWLKNRCPESWDDKKQTEETDGGGIVILPEITELLENAEKNE